MYLIDSKHLTIALLHFLQLPQKVPSRTKQLYKHINTKSKIHQQIHIKREKKSHTRTWIWRELHQQPKASSGKSWDAHRSPSAKLFRPPDTDGTAQFPIQHINYTSKTLDQSNLMYIQREIERERDLKDYKLKLITL